MDSTIASVLGSSPRVEPDRPSASPRWPLVLLLAITAGLVVMNIYYNQPILNAIAASLSVNSSAVAWISTATQLGYATGLLFVLPVGDNTDRKWLIVLTTFLSSLALTAIPLSPTLGIMLLSSFGVGITSVTPQLVVPYAASLVTGSGRGKVVGLVMSGLLIGILASRSLSGWVSSRLSWHIVFWLAAGVMLLLSGILWVALPSQAVRSNTSYGSLLASLSKLLRSEPILRRHSVIGFLAFGSFGVFWTTLGFYLHSRPEHYGSEVTGMFGLVAITGALVVPLAGQVAEKCSPKQINGFFLILVLLAFIVLLFSNRNTLLMLGMGVVLLDAGIQGNQIANQARIYSLDRSLHSRINSIYMVAYFLGGAVGSVLGAQAWTLAGWPGVCCSGIGLTIAALLVLWM